MKDFWWMNFNEESNISHSFNEIFMNQNHHDWVSALVTGILIGSIELFYSSFWGSSFYK